MVVSVKASPPIKRVAPVGNTLGTGLLVLLCAARDFRKWSEPEVFGFSGGVTKARFLRARWLIGETIEEL
jgi:hypothetical protein